MKNQLSIWRSSDKEFGGVPLTCTSSLTFPFSLSLSLVPSTLFWPCPRKLLLILKSTLSNCLIVLIYHTNSFMTIPPTLPNTFSSCQTPPGHPLTVSYHLYHTIPHYAKSHRTMPHLCPLLAFISVVCVYMVCSFMIYIWCFILFL